MPATPQNEAVSTAGGEQRTVEVEAAQTRVINLVNTFFRDKLEGVPTIREYIRTMQEATA